MKKSLLLPFLCLFWSAGVAFSQQPATSGEAVREAIQKKEQLTRTSEVRNLPLKNIGPTVMSGRVTDFAVNPNNPIEFYVAYSTGGVWYTNNNGTSFTPIMDNASTQNVGDIAVDWTNGTIWVGTGEVNASRSTYAGVGLLKSEDQGETWQFMGLPDSHHISRILINPDDPNEVIVGVIGHLYSTNKERGIFKTTDGGKTWNKTLYINDQTGIIDVAVTPGNFGVMYAAAWDKDRKAWNFRGSGEGSGIYKSIDAGSSWTKVSGANSGFPTGKGVGRIGLSVYDGETLYAIVDNQNYREKEEKEEKTETLQKEDFKRMSASEVVKLENEKLENYLRSNNFKEKYTAESVKELIRKGEVKPVDLALYLEDANSIMFDTPVIGAEVYKSTDGGMTWTKTHDEYLDDLYYSYGYYFGMVHVDPSDKDAIYVYGVPILKSKDGGKSFTSIDAENVHADHHALWINPERPGHLIDGNDGGINISYDDGENWEVKNSPAVGQFYAVQVDNRKPYNVYGGLQDNGVWYGSHTNVESPRWQVTGDYNFKRIMGGDGMQIEVDSRNPNIVYTGFQFGNYFRLDLATGEQKHIQPKHDLGERPYRFNWQTPILLSPHNQDILYLGGNKLMRSMDRGESWTAISGDLTTGGKSGNVPFGTLASISESPFQFGLIYTGSDDGLVQVTRDGGANWTRISNNLPKDLWVSRVIASEHKKERVYATLNGYRWDDFNPYVYVSEDYGKSWKSINGDLPLSSVNVIREDPKNENVLYLGTDNGLYVSMNGGQNWQPFKTGIPNVAVHDLRVQEEAQHLVVGTHGRSIYIADVAAISGMDPKKIGKEVWLAPVADVKFSPRWGSSYNKWRDPFVPNIDLVFYSNAAGTAQISIENEDGITVREMEAKAEKGYNQVRYDLTITEESARKLSEETAVKADKPSEANHYVPKGTYTIRVSVNGSASSQDLKVK